MGGCGARGLNKFLLFLGCLSSIDFEDGSLKIRILAPSLGSWHSARVAKLADAIDSKSIDLTVMSVQVRPRAPFF